MKMTKAMHKQIVSILLVLSLIAAYTPAIGVENAQASRAPKKIDKNVNFKVSIEDDFQMAEAKQMVKEYLLGEYESVVGDENYYCPEVWQEIQETYAELVAFVDDAEEESALFVTDGFFLYLAADIEEGVALLSELAGMNKHYIKDKNDLGRLQDELRGRIEESKDIFYEFKNDYNSFYWARVIDAIDDAYTELSKATSFKACVKASVMIDETLEAYTNEMSGDVFVIGEDEGATTDEFAWIYTNDELAIERQAVTNKIMAYVDVQLKRSGYSGDIGAISSQAQTVIKRLANIEIAEDIHETGDEWLESMIAKTGIEYEDATSSDKTRAIKKLNELAMQYSERDYSEDQWYAVESAFLTAYTIIEEAEKAAELETFFGGIEKELKEIPTLAQELDTARKAAIKELKKYKNTKKYKSQAGKLANQGIGKIKKANAPGDVEELLNQYKAMCNKHIKKYKITVQKKGKGKVTKTKMVAYGKTFTIKIQPKAGYKIKRVTIDGKKKKLKNKYKIKNVKKAHKVRVVFGK